MANHIVLCLLISASWLYPCTCLRLISSGDRDKISAQAAAAIVAAVNAYADGFGKTSAVFHYGAEMWHQYVNVDGKQILVSLYLLHDDCSTQPGGTCRPWDIDLDLQVMVKAWARAVNFFLYEYATYVNYRFKITYDEPTRDELSMEQYELQPLDGIISDNRDCDPFITSLFSGPLFEKGTTLWSKQFLLSQNQRFFILMQADCNLVLYRRTAGSKPPAKWSSQTDGKGENCYATLQVDGNLVVYDRNHKPVWSSRTYCDGCLKVTTAVMQNDGNFVLYEEYGNGLYNAIFSSDTQGP